MIEFFQQYRALDVNFLEAFKTPKRRERINQFKEELADEIVSLLKLKPFAEASLVRFLPTALFARVDPSTVYESMMYGPSGQMGAENLPPLPPAIQAFMKEKMKVMPAKLVNGFVVIDPVGKLQPSNMVAIEVGGGGGPTVFCLSDNAGVLSQFQAALRKRGSKEITILKHMRQLRAALQWAYDLELLDRMPAIPKVVRGSIPKTMKGRPLTDAEFTQFLEAVGRVVGADQVEHWRFFARGLWCQGLRDGEALQLSWDAHDRHRVDLVTQSHPVIWIRGQLEKGKRDRLHPIAPEFAELLKQVPVCDRAGMVFQLPGIKRSTISHIGSAIGREAGILVRKDALNGKEKFASFHDLRRSCALRWAKHLLPQELMEFMRHSSMQVTLDYYVGQRAIEVAEKMHGCGALTGREKDAGA